MNLLKDWFLALQVKDIISLVAWVVGGLSILIEFNKKIPLHPLSHIVKWMGSILNRETLEKLNEIVEKSSQTKEEVKEINERLTRFEEDTNDKRAVDMRNQIINFSEDLRLGHIFSVKQFETIMCTVSRYYDHCEKHNIKNHYIDEETAYIREKFREARERK